ncbi:MAG TPA: gamma-glutamyl-gamma-aminobutyrate hydrolase family protein [Candidatus Saccharimonadales bacterium]|nr:gamma-glutamyl-gamma-aminobutyrate hydrolase family protein [Candidatus Saccharimonadales bacterium]
MNVLLVDNKSAHLVRLKQLIESTFGVVTFRLHDPRDMAPTDVEWADLVVFSGGWGRSIVKNPQTFKRMVDLCVEHRKPTIGICLGAEAIAVYFGSRLSELPVRRVGNVRMHFTDDFHGAAGLEPSVMVYEFHKWTIDTVQPPLIALATSKDGPELFKHTDLPLWGMQFHPEVERLGNKGRAVFEYVASQLRLPKG